MLGIRAASGGAASPPPPPASYGPELVLNGTFDSGTSNWTNSGTGSLSVVAGKMRVTSAGADNGAGQTIFGMEAGATYRFAATMAPSESDRARIALAVATNQSFYFAVVGGSVDIEFVSAGSGIDIYLQAANASAWASSGAFAEFDNVSLKKRL